MANIESKLTTIKSASGGEDVRDAIIGALRDINNDVPADMSNPEHIVIDMPAGSDKTVPFNPPKLVSEIYVKQPNTGGKSMTTPDITITENGEYPADDPSYDPDEEIRYYSKVTVKVPQLANAVMDLEEEITQNGTYSAPADWGVDGLRTFTVNVSGASGDGPFQVEFYDKVQSDPTAKVIYTELVPKGGSAEFHGTTPTSEIGPLVGWNPSPVNVTRDMKCYPKFSQIVIDPTEIGDDWTVICANGGQPYPLWSHKGLAYGATFTESDIKRWYPSYSGGSVEFNTYMMMYKVGEGEGNSHSSWVSCAIGIGNIPGIWQSMKPGWAQQAQDHIGLREFLNGAFFDHCSSMFRNSIIPVTKYSKTKDNIAYPTQDHIWILGTSEIGTYQTKPEGSDTFDFTQSTSWSGSYVNNLNLLDNVSTKYIRDYLNNDRAYLFTLGHDRYDAYVGNIALREHIRGDVMGQIRSPSSSSQLLAYVESYPPSYINIGFCL